MFALKLLLSGFRVYGFIGFRVRNITERSVTGREDGGTTAGMAAFATLKGFLYK